MTLFDAATTRHSTKPFCTAALIAVLGLGLAGCETAGGLLGGTSTTPEVAPPPVAAVQQPLARIALAPIIGAPETVSKQLVAQLGQTGDKQRITVLGDRDPSGEYTLRGYIVAARDKAGTKISYIWDLADGTGRRVNRITGEEVVAAQPNAKDPWAAVTPAVTQSIADKTIASLATWLPTQKPAAGTPVAATPTQPPASGAGAGTVAPPTAPLAVPVARAPAVSNQVTAALPKAEEILAAGPVVTGAPGDGNAALAAALQRELARQGVAMGDRPGVSYRIEGQVRLGAPQDGKQAIQIDWRVKDPQGKSLGTVSQKNDIPPGSLDGTWGKTADAAAAAAAQGIVKLLPQPKSTN